MNHAASAAGHAQLHQACGGIALQLAALADAGGAGMAVLADGHAVLQGQRRRALQVGADQHGLTIALGLDGHGQLGDVDHGNHLWGVTLAFMLLPVWLSEYVP